MGEVRARVELTNAVDEALLRRGQLSPDQVRVYEADALVDTGVVRSVLPPHVVQQFGLALRGQRVAEYADGRKEQRGRVRRNLDCAPQASFQPGYAG